LHSLRKEKTNEMYKYNTDHLPVNFLLNMNVHYGKYTMQHFIY
jgi:hypothetical protein